MVCQNRTLKITKKKISTSQNRNKKLKNKADPKDKMAEIGNRTIEAINHSKENHSSPEKDQARDNLGISSQERDQTIDNSGQETNQGTTSQDNTFNPETTSPETPSPNVKIPTNPDNSNQDSTTNNTNQDNNTSPGNSSPETTSRGSRGSSRGSRDREGSRVREGRKEMGIGIGRRNNLGRGKDSLGRGQLPNKLSKHSSLSNPSPKRASLNHRADRCRGAGVDHK
jgi:hypothetical protein